MVDEPYDMWDYWCDKYGEVEALKRYYPNTLNNSPKLQFCVNQIEVCEDAIANELENLAMKEFNEAT